MSIKSLRQVSGGLVTLLLTSALASQAHALQIQFNYTFGASVNEATRAQVRAAYQRAGQFWTDRLGDNITIRLNAGFAPLAATTLAQTGSTRLEVSYAAVRNALIADATTPDDQTAISHLPTGDSLSFYHNALGIESDGVAGLSRTEVRNAGIIYNDGSNGQTDDNRLMFVNSANLKAIGIDPSSLGQPYTGLDGSVTFNSSLAFDLDRSDGITANTTDFVAVATHEIGHALGFVSGVDFVDLVTGRGPFSANFGPVQNQIDPLGSFTSVLDLYRYSDLSFDANGQFRGFDYTTGLGFDRPGDLDQLTAEDFLSLNASSLPTVLPYFSIDGGATRLQTFSNGAFNGTGFRLRTCDGFLIQPNATCNGVEAFVNAGPYQASHWIETFFFDQELGLPVGILDPSFPRNRTFDPTELDYLAFDVIGYDKIPEPASIALLGLGLMGAAALRGRRRAA